jgi:hypothetical protein
MKEKLVKIAATLFIAMFLMSIVFFNTAKASASEAFTSTDQIKTISQPENSNLTNGTKTSNLTLVIPSIMKDEYALEKQTFCKFLNQIAGLKTQNYILSYYQITSSPVAGSNKIETSISAMAKKDFQVFDISMIIIEGKVRFYDLSLVNGSLTGEELNVDDRLATSKDVVKNYQTDFNANYCSALDSMIPTKIQTENFSITNQATVLSIENFKDNPIKSTELSWYKIIGNDTIYKQSIHVIIAKNGLLTYFTDTMGFYTIATTKTVITNQTAINIAMPIIEAFANEKDRIIESIEAKFSYEDDTNSTRGNSYLIYPMWTISASFETSRENEIDGYAVNIWADSGSIYEQNAQGYYKSLNTENSVLNQSITNASATIIVIIVIGAVICIRRVKRLRFEKNNIRKIGGLLAVLALITCLIVIQPVNATNPSSIFGTPVTDYVPENVSHYSFTNTLSQWSTNAGYDAQNNYGPDTTAANLVIGAYDDGQPGSIVFHIGHGRNTPNYAILADSNTWVTAQYIYDNSVSQSSGHHKFVVMWSCYQGDDMGEMCEAWLHTTSLSSDGYNNPDYSGQCFIGWHHSAPYLTNTINDEGSASFAFLNDFYDAALNKGFNINAALDYAAEQLWNGDPFGDCCLSTGDGIPEGAHIHVFGQGTLHIGYSRWCSSFVDSAHGYRVHAVDNPTGFTGAQDDGQFTHLHAGEYGDFAWVTGQMSAESSGDVYLTAHSGAGYITHFIVSVSYYNNYDWEVICDSYAEGTNVQYFHCGDTSNFRYIGIAVVDDTGYSACLYIDAVHVQTEAY